MAIKFVNESDITTVADAIRTKGGTDAQLVFPEGMAAAIAAIQTGAALPVLDTPAAVAQVLAGLEFIDGEGVKKTGTMPEISESELAVKNSNGTLYISPSDDGFVTGEQHGAVPAASLDADLIAGNIRHGATVFGVDGTCQVGYIDYTVTGFSAGNAETLLDWISANLPELAVGETRAAVIIGNTATSNYAMRGFTQSVKNSTVWLLNITRAATCVTITGDTSNPAGTPCYISDGATIRVYEKVVSVS